MQPSDPVATARIRTIPVVRAKSPITLRHVAQDAQVSAATVSRALSNPDKVRPATLARVLAAAQARGYVLDGAARALRERRSRTIGAVIPTLDNAIFANATHALQKTLERRGYTLLVACHEYDLASEVHIARQLAERGVDGLVLVGLDHRAELYESLKAAGLPFLLTWALDRSGQHPCVGFDNHAAAARLVRYLADLGHREFAMIAGETPHNDRARGRVEGVTATLAMLGLALPPERLIERPYTFPAAREAMRALAALSPRPTAVVCGNDVLAIGALAECRALDIAVPGELSLTGFDDLDFAALTTPTLTTIRVPSHALGEASAHALLRMVTGEAATCCHELGVDLVVRETTGPPRDHRGAASPGPDARGRLPERFRTPR
jgi:LacI family transcriptional regulator